MDAASMTWSPVTMRWPEQATQWMGGLSAAKDLATGELASTAQRLAGLSGLANTNPGPVGDAAKGAIEAGRTALAEQLGQVPSCLVVTPFQSGIGQGKGYQRYLSAPNVLEHLAKKLEDATDAGRPVGPQYALSILFLGTRLEQLASGLSRFNALLPIGDLVRTERRAQHLMNLETEKWEIPGAVRCRAGKDCPWSAARWSRLPSNRWPANWPCWRATPPTVRRWAIWRRWPLARRHSSRGGISNWLN